MIRSFPGGRLRLLLTAVAPAVLLAFAAGSGAQVFTPTTYREDVLADGPVAYWRLGEATGNVAVDETGANNGTYNGGVTLADPGALPGESNSSARFDGVNDYVFVPVSTSLDMTTAVTVELWVKRTKNKAVQVLVGKPGESLSKRNNYAVWWDTTNRIQAAFGNGTKQVNVTGVVLDTAWHHVVATYDNATARLYVDGAVQATKTSAVALTPNVNPLNIGRAAADSSFFGGQLDEIAIYDTVLSASRIQSHYNQVFVDTVSPVVTLTQPAGGSSTSDATPIFSGVAGAASGDSATVTVNVWGGAAPSGPVVQTLTASRAGDGYYSVTSAVPLADGTYTARAEQLDATGNVGQSAPATFVVDTTGAIVEDPVLIGAGDIASCGSSDGDSRTAALLAQEPQAIVYTLGDLAYPNGQPDEYNICYEQSWGSTKARTRPIPGGHDLQQVAGGPPAGTGYVNYFAAQLAPFGPTATDLTKLYYSYDVGAWHVVMLNAGCYFDTPGCSAAAMEQWFRDDLQAHPNLCTVAMWHDPRFSSGAIHGNASFVQPLWSVAHEHGVDVVLNGHEHDYERFAPMDAAGNADPAFGVREFVVGTGGYYLYQLGTLKPNSQVFSNAGYGVLKLTLHPTSYAWQFVSEAGGTFSDSGTTACHGRAAPVAGAPAVRSVASSTATHPSTSLVINQPAGTTPGDLLFAAVSHQGGSIRSMTPPFGWTAVPNTDLYETTNARIHAWYRVAGNTEPAFYTFALTGGSGMALGGGIMAITGAHPTGPINVCAGQVTPANQITLPAPSITTTVATTLLVYAGAINAPLTFTQPNLMGEQWDVKTFGTYNIATEVATQALGSAGATGSKAATLSATAKGPAFLCAIAPAP